MKLREKRLLNLESLKGERKGTKSGEKRRLDARAETFSVILMPGD